MRSNHIVITSRLLSLATMRISFLNTVREMIDRIIRARIGAILADRIY